MQAVGSSLNPLEMHKEPYRHGFTDDHCWLGVWEN